MKFRFLLLLLFIPGLCVLATNPVDDFCNCPLLQNANISLLIKDMKTGDTLAVFRPNALTTPASTMKVVTTSTILEQLGPDFRFQTRLYADGPITKDSILIGNLYIRGGGDPTLGSDKTGTKNFLPQWVTVLHQNGIKSIQGQIIADEGNFEDQLINPKWIWEDMGNYYAPAIHGISYLDNTFRMYFKSGAVGTQPTILRTEPQIENLSVDNHLTSAAIGFDNAYFYGAPNSYQRSIFGEIPANRDEFVVKGDIPEPGLLLAMDLQKAMNLQQANIKTNPVVMKCKYEDKRLLYTHFSPPLKEIITETNIKSNNHYAEYLFKTISTQNSEYGSSLASAKCIRKFWKEKGMPIDQLVQHDGSGLSPCDAVSAGFFVNLLSYMYQNSKYNKEFFNSLPVSGGRGTLSTFLNDTALQGKVHAKSGTIESVKCYCGYIELKNKTLVFALMVNNPNGTHKQVIKKMEQLLLSITQQ